MTYVCGGSPGEPGSPALFSLEPEPAKENCPEGGVKIASGVDRDNDGVPPMSATHLYALEVLAPGTCQMVENGDFSSGLDGWTITDVSVSDAPLCTGA